MRHKASARTRVASLPLPKVWSKSMSGLVADEPLRCALTSVPTIEVEDELVLDEALRRCQPLRLSQARHAAEQGTGDENSTG
jgi:hypothetical protein